jgi:uncharacterized protein YndB with AHSA1/START domain
MKKATGQVEGNDLVITRTFEAPIEDVWASITESERTSRWYGTWTGTPGAGNTIAVKMLFEGDGPLSEMHIDACEPPRHLALSSSGPWGVSIEVTLVQTGNSTKLWFVHHLTSRKLARDFGPGWEYYLDNLVAARANENLPDFKDYDPALRAHYTVDT